MRFSLIKAQNGKFGGYFLLFYGIFIN